VAERIVHEIDARGRSRAMQHRQPCTRHQLRALAALGRGDHAARSERAAAVCTPGEHPARGAAGVLLGHARLGRRAPWDAATDGGGRQHVETVRDAGISRCTRPRLRS
jgi:hypothetical protein